MICYAELQKAMFDFAYGSALDDAIVQKAFEGKKKPLRNNEEAREITQQYINDILDGEHPDFYETTKALEASFESYIRNNMDEIIYIKKTINRQILFSVLEMRKS